VLHRGSRSPAGKLLPETLDDLGKDNPVRVVDAFVDALDLEALGFEGVVPAGTASIARPVHGSRRLNISRPHDQVCVRCAPACRSRQNA
jgi:hypothetical protein